MKNTPKIINFNKAYEAPKNKLNPKRNLVEWGEDNDYPTYLLDLYNNYGSTTHKSIVNKKVKLISGQGFEDVSNIDLNNFIKRNRLEFETRKITFDYEIFNGFAFELIYDRMGENLTSLKHIPLNQIRHGIKNEDLQEDYFWISKDWNKYRKDLYKPKYIKSFDNSREGRQLFYYCEYNPGNDGYYPVPGYSTSLNWIEMDYQISQFHLNQAKQGYAPSFILNIASGFPSQDEMDEFYKQFKRNFSGTENAGKAMITYSDGSDNKPEIIPFDLNDSDDRFMMLMDQIEKNIVMGAEIPPQLIILTPGKLSSTQERKELLEEYQKSYISPRQNVVEESLNSILDFDEDLILKKYQL